MDTQYTVLLYRQGTGVPSDLNAMVKAMQGHVVKTMRGQLQNLYLVLPQAP